VGKAILVVAWIRVETAAHGINLQQRLDVEVVRSRRVHDHVAVSSTEKEHHDPGHRDRWRHHFVNFQSEYGQYSVVG
jgi:hypothetical protein